MQNAFGLRIRLVDVAVNEKRGRFERVFACEHPASAIDQQNVAGGDLTPVHALRVDQVAVRFELQRKMVTHAFIEAAARGPAQRRGEIDAALVGG